MIKATNIVWDVDWPESENQYYGLRQEVFLSPNEIEESNANEENIAKYLRDKYGYPVKSFSLITVEDLGRMTFGLTKREDGNYDVDIIFEDAFHVYADQRENISLDNIGNISRELVDCFSGKQEEQCQDDFERNMLDFLGVLKEFEQ